MNKGFKQTFNSAVLLAAFILAPPKPTFILPLACAVGPITSNTISPSSSFSITDQDELFGGFRKAAERGLKKTKLFTKDEVQEILNRLSKVNEALNQWPYLRLIVDEKTRLWLGDVPGEDALSLIESAPTLLGIKPMVSIDVTKNGHRALETWIWNLRNAGLLDLFSRSVRFRDSFPAVSQDSLYPLKERMVWIFAMDRVRETVPKVADPLIREQLSKAGIFKVIEQSDAEGLIDALTSMLGAQHAIGVLFGYPEPAVAGLIQNQPGIFIQSRWIGLSIKDTAGRPELIKRTIDRFDAMAELMADYLREIRKVPMDIRSLPRWLGIESAQRPRKRVLSKITLRSSLRPGARRSIGREVSWLDKMM